MSVMSVGQLQSLIIKTVGIHNNDIKNQLFYDNYDGVECEVLRPGDQGWKKGKLKVELTVKFYPDELEEENKAENSDNNNSEVLEGRAVFQINESTGKNLGLRLNFEDLYMTVAQLQRSIIRVVNIYDNKIKNQLFDDGLKCEVLRPGTQGWQTGKLKVEFSVKFYLDEPQEEIEENELSNSENKGENSGNNNSEVMTTQPSPLDDLRQFHQENQ
jgi:hypothetical protein